MVNRVTFFVFSTTFISDNRRKLFFLAVCLFYICLVSCPSYFAVQQLNNFLNNFFCNNLCLLNPYIFVYVYFYNISEICYIFCIVLCSYLVFVVTVYVVFMWTHFSSHRDDCPWIRTVSSSFGGWDQACFTRGVMVSYRYYINPSAVPNANLSSTTPALIYAYMVEWCDCVFLCVITLTLCSLHNIRLWYSPDQVHPCPVLVPTSSCFFFEYLAESWTTEQQ